MRRRPFPICFTLLTTLLVGVQSLSAGLTSCCDAAGLLSAARSQADTSEQSRCCHSQHNSCCSTKAHCRCGPQTTQRCSGICSCGNDQRLPATPRDSEGETNIRQLLTDNGTPLLLSVSVAQTRRAAPTSVRPTVKAGVNALLCVWLT